MSNSFARITKLPETRFLKQHTEQGALLTLDIDITARCNNDCRHCYINLPAGDQAAKSKELSLDEISHIADEAVSLGAMWCLLSGGEPLLRDDFIDIYLCMKRKGLLVSVFTNATLITDEHLKLFQRYPPRDIEVSVYGVTERTYESVTRRPGTFRMFMRGVESILSAGIKTRFKAMALRSNVHELPAIAAFCRERTKDHFRFDPWLHLRYDGDERRNDEIRSERLTPEEFVQAERGDSERLEALERACGEWILTPVDGQVSSAQVIFCGAGLNSCSISSEGSFRLCASLGHPECICDLRKGNLTEAYRDLVPKVRSMRTHNQELLGRCSNCAIVNFCMWCPAHAYLETGRVDAPVDYFCQVAHARARALGVESNVAPPSG